MVFGPLRDCVVLGILAGLAAGCGRPGEVEQGWMPGDSLENRPSGRPIAAPGASPDTGGEAATACLMDTLDAGRLDIAARWDGGHVRLSGAVSGGAGKVLYLRLAHGDRFVYDEVFRGERVGAVTLPSNTIDLVSETYAPSPDELEAFRRTGAGPREPGRPLCLDLSLYEPRTLDRIAARQIPLPPSP